MGVETRCVYILRFGLNFFSLALYIYTMYDKGAQTMIIGFSVPFSIVSLSLPGYQEVDLFSEIRGVNFDNVFGKSEPQQQQQQQAPSFGGGNPATQQPHPSLMGGGILTPQAVGPLASQSVMQPQPQRLTKDVDSSLARAAENLSMSTSTTSSSNNSYFSTAWPPTTASGNVSTSSPHQVGRGINNITGTSPWTSAHSAGGQLQWPQGVPAGPAKNTLDDIALPESLLAGTVGVKTDKVSCGVHALVT